MAGASIEATLELWASSLRDVKAQLRPLFRQERVAASAWKFLDGLLGNEPRKTGWMRAEADQSVLDLKRSFCPLQALCRTFYHFGIGPFRHGWQAERFLGNGQVAVATFLD